MNHKNSLSVSPVETRIFHAGENLGEFILQAIREKPAEKSILAITSKIVSLAENRLVPHAGTEKGQLIRQESDHYLGEIGYGCHLTVKHGLFIASAGIDESNSERGDYILYPEDPFRSAQKLWQALKEVWNLKELGIIITDSHTTPLRRGVTGISLSHWGFKAVKSMVGCEDLFGRKLQYTSVNAADGLAAAATLMMGEGREARPLCWLQGAEVEFAEEIHPSEVRIPLQEDLYYPLFQKAEVEVSAKSRP